MIFQQIHSLPTGPKWGKVVLITASVIIAACLAYQAIKHVNLKTAPKRDPEDKTG